jgi:hypothetical protein
MSLTVNTKTYSADNFGQNAVSYNGPAHTLSILDDIQLKRVYPKPTSLFSGVGRTTAKLSRTLTLAGVLTPTGVAIVEINVSVPVGAAAADIDALLNDMGSYLSSASAKTQVKGLQINF